MYKFQNLNQALIGMSKELIKNGVERKTRGFSCYEIPNPVLICIENPCDRYVNIPERKWNKTLPFAESLWMALGLNDLNSLPGDYVKSLYNFSDNGSTWRAGYGSRIRYFSGHNQDYWITDKKTAMVYSGSINFTDQLKFVLMCFDRDINTRQAIITIGDPAKDCFDVSGDLKITKDYPCTRSIHFQINTDGELDCIVDIRSNDLLWGFSAVNVFNFTFMQEYISNIIGVPVGKYYHKADNLHYYDNFREKIEFFASLDINSFETKELFYYGKEFKSLVEFDREIERLYMYERYIKDQPQPLHSNKPNFIGDFINDWAKVFYIYWSKEKVQFENPLLNRLFYEQ